MKNPTRAGLQLRWAPPLLFQHRTCRYLIATAAIFFAAGLGALGQDSQVVAWGAPPAANVPAGLSNVVAISAGASHGLALQADGRIVSWGGSPTLPDWQNHDVVAIAAGVNYDLALRADGRVMMWGSGATVPAGLSNVVAVAAGASTSLALQADGKVVAWGTGDLAQTNVPSTLSNVVAIAAGDSQCIALQADNTFVVWPTISINRTNLLPPDLSNVVAIGSGEIHDLALRRDGTVVAWGYFNLHDTPVVPAKVPSGLSDVVAIAAGMRHDLALRADGTVVAWGMDFDGETRPPTWLSNVVAVSAGPGLSLALLGQKSPLALRPAGGGTNQSGHPWRLTVSAQGAWPLAYQWLRNGQAIPGATNTLILLNSPSAADSGLYSVQVSNPTGSVESPSTQVTFVDVAPTIRTQPVSVAVRLAQPASLATTVDGSWPMSYQWWHDGDPVPFGTNATLDLGFAQPSEAGRYWLVASNLAGSSTSVVATVAVSAILAWGDNSYGQTNVPTSLSNAVIVAVAGGEAHSLALRSDGQVVAWGRYYNGDSTNGSSIYLPAAVPDDLSHVVAIASGRWHMLALRADGTVAAWGFKGNGRTDVPAGLGNVVAIAAGFGHSLALRADGTVAAWGYNGAGQTSVPAGLSNVVAIAAGFGHSLALRADGTVVGWGDNSQGRISIPVGMSNVIAIAAGFYHSLALQADGQVRSWGYNFDYGSRPVPAGLGNVVAIAAGRSLSVALRADGTVAAWGERPLERTNVPAGLTGVMTAAGESHTLAVAAWAPVVFQPLGGGTVPAGHPWSLRATASGPGQSSYQWLRDGQPIPGATNAVLLLSSPSTGDSGLYSVRVSNALGTTTSPGTTVTVLDTAPRLVLDASSLLTGVLRLNVPQWAGTSPCVIETSTNLQDWVPVLTNAPPGAAFQYTTPFSPAGPAQFYRAAGR